MQRFWAKQAVLVVVFKTKAVDISFQSQKNVLNHIQHSKTLFFNAITSNIAIIY